MFVFSAFWGGVRLALDERIPTHAPLSRKLLCLSSLRTWCMYVRFLLNSPCTVCFQTLFLGNQRTMLLGDCLSRTGVLFFNCCHICSTFLISCRSVGEVMLKILPHDFSVPKPIPTFGNRSTRRWYSQYQRMVSLVPVLGIMFTR